jgi:ABC-type uncharacterized transport system permease subunit
MTEFLAAAIRIATPLMFAALGGILSERAGVFAVGLEGMMLAGAFAAVVGTWWSGDAGAGVLLATVAGAAIGLMVATVAVRFRADNMVTGLTANILALGLTSYLLRVLAGGGQPVAIHLTPLAAWPIPGLADLPVLGPLLFVQPPLTYLVVLGCLMLALFLRHTQAGLTLRASGENPEAVFAAGGNPLRVRMLAVIACGAIAGLGGALVAASRHLHGRHDRRARLSGACVADRRTLGSVGGGSSVSGVRHGGGVRVALAEFWRAGQLVHRAYGAVSARACRIGGSGPFLETAGRDRAASAKRLTGRRWKSKFAKFPPACAAAP